MRDLKHSYAIEKLLEQANNDLVRQANAEGRVALGYTCHFVPEPLLNLGNAFSVKLRAPLTGSLDISTYYLSSFLCGYAKAVLERGIEGGYGFLGALLASETCSEMNRTMEHFELLGLVEDERFFVTFLDAPFKISENGINHYVKQIQAKILEPLGRVYGIEATDDAIRAAVARHNRVCDVINAIGEYKKEERPRVTGTEFHMLNLASYVCPKDLILPLLEETLEELETRQPDPAGKYRARIVLVGSELDDWQFTQLVEECGAFVAADRYCFGALPGRQRIELPEGEDPLRAVALHYMQTSQCPRFMGRDKVEGRRSYVRALVDEFHADGVVYQMLKFCEYWGYERALASHVMADEFGLPAITTDRQYTLGGSGQLRTRIQAFVESLEIKKLHKARKGAAK